MFIKPAKTFIEEIDSFIPAKNRDKVIEVRANNVIGAAINIIKLLEEHYSEEEVVDLTKKFLLAIKTKESKKFTNKLRMLTESRKKK